jgi:hypothetical protein
MDEGLTGYRRWAVGAILEIIFLDIRHWNKFGTVGGDEWGEEGEQNTRDDPSSRPGQI